MQGDRDIEPLSKDAAPGFNLILGRFAFDKEMGGGRRQFRINGRGSMLAYIWEDGRFLGFDLVEWLAWLAAVSILALFTLAT